MSRHSSGGEGSVVSALLIKKFRFYIFARLSLSLGIQIQATIIAWQVFKITNDVLSLGLVGLAEAIPFISVALLGGYIADNFNRKKIIIYSTLVLALASFGLFFVSFNAQYLQQYSTTPIYIMICLTGIARGFLSSSYFAFMSHLVPREKITNASTWNSSVWHIAAVTGPAMGSWAIAWFGITLSYIVVAVLVVGSIIFILGISYAHPANTNAKEPLFKSLSTGLKFVFNNQIILGALSLDLFAVLFGGAVALLPGFVEVYFNNDVIILGWLRSAPAMGAVLMAAVLMFKPPGKRAGVNLLVSVFLFGVSIILFALSQNFWLSMLMLIISGAVDNVSVVIRHSILQLMTPDEMRGRVASVNSIFIGSSNEIGAFESGVMAKAMGLVPSVIFGGGMTMIITLITSRVAPKLKSLNLNKL